MKKIFIVLFCLISLVSKAQVYQSMPQYGYGPVKRFDIDSSLTIPTTCGVPTLRTTLTKKAAIAFDSCNNRFYQYNPKTLTWSVISGGGGSTDTTSLSNRINAKADTSALNLKLNISDTANKWVNSVTKLDDSTFQVIKGTTTTNLTITGTTYANKLKTKVWNTSGATITKGSVIYINGKHSSNLPTIALAQANTELNSYATFALVENDISDNSEGTVIQAGTISNLNLPTASFTDGDLLYLSPTVAGGITTTKPLAPYHIVKLGTIVRAHPTLGTIELKIENGWQLDELSDVQIAAVPADSTILQFSRVDSLWHDVSVTTAIGTNYLKPTDTTSLSSRINTKLTASDTSSLSSRINAKGYAITIGHTQSNYLASTTYYYGMTATSFTTTAAIRRIYIPVSGTIKAAYLYARTTGATSTQAWTMSIRLNNSSNNSIGSVADASLDKVWSNTGLSISVVAGDYIEITTTTPAWTTAAGNTTIYGTIFIQ